MDLKLFDSQTFRGVRDAYDWPWQKARLIEYVQCSNCSFEGSSLSINATPERRTTVRNCELSNCTVEGVSADSAIIEDTIVTDLKCRNVLHLGGSVYKHVTLMGNIDRILTLAAPPAVGSGNHIDKWYAANQRYYEGVDWALDISEARVKDLDLRGVPGNLVRRDRNTQALITRDCALSGRWCCVPLDHTPFKVTIDWFLKYTPWDSAVLICAKRSRDFNAQLTALQRLRDLGLVDLA